MNREEELAKFQRGLSQRKLASLGPDLDAQLGLLAHLDGVPQDMLLDRAVRQYVVLRMSRPGMRTKLREFLDEGEFDDGP